MTTATADASTRRPERVRPLTWSRNQNNVGANLFVFGFSAAIRRSSDFVSAIAAASVIPGLSRPMTESVFPQRFVSGVNGNGVNRSMRVPGENTEPKSNDAGSTPITVVETPLIVTARPTTLRSEPNRCCHNA